MDCIKVQKLSDVIRECSLKERKTYLIIENEFMYKPAKARVTGPASLSCISKSSMLAIGSLLEVSKGGSSRLEEVAVLRPLSWRLVESTELTGGFVIKIMAGVLKTRKPPIIIIKVEKI